MFRVRTRACANFAAAVAPGAAACCARPPRLLAAAATRSAASCAPAPALRRRRARAVSARAPLACGAAAPGAGAARRPAARPRTPRPPRLGVSSERGRALAHDRRLRRAYAQPRRRSSAAKQSASARRASSSAIWRTRSSAQADHAPSLLRAGQSVERAARAWRSFPPRPDARRGAGCSTPRSRGQDERLVHRRVGARR